MEDLPPAITPIEVFGSGETVDVTEGRDEDDAEICA